MKTHLFLYPGRSSKQPRLPSGVTLSHLSRPPALAAEEIAHTMRDETIDVLAFWDPELGPVSWDMVSRFRGSLDDAWHPGTRAVGNDEPDLLAYVQPLWMYRPPPRRDLAGAIAWRFDLRSLFVRSSVVRGVGGFDGTFDTLAGMARELGLRLIRRGAICRQWPDLIAADADDGEPPTLADRYRIVRRQVSGKWTAYVVLRRAFQHPRRALSELRAWRETASDRTSSTTEPGSLHRDLERPRIPDRPTVSVILPTIGRYRYVAEVLEDLCSQTVPPTQILIADGNPPSDRQPDLYQRFADQRIEVLWHEETGLCSGRNACLERATGEYVWFVDDDSRFDARNLEWHLRVLAAYGADVSVGPAYMRSRPELAANQREIACGFMDCGTTVCRRSLIDEVGGFDMQFNQHLLGEDNDLGIRMLRSGGLILNNPLAKRFHYLAPIGGSRSKGSAHVFRRFSLRPRPVQSIYYLARRHFEPSVVWDAMLQASITVGWRRRDAAPPSRMWRAKTFVAEALALPLTAVRYIRSARIGRQMIEQGPRIPKLAGARSAQLGRMTPK